MCIRDRRIHGIPCFLLSQGLHFHAAASGDQMVKTDALDVVGVNKKMCIRDRLQAFLGAVIKRACHPHLPDRKACLVQEIVKAIVSNVIHTSDFLYR